VTEKELIALLILTGLGLVITTGCLVSSRFRDLSFMGLVFGCAFTERMDVNFFSHAWYRGTTRGIEVSPIDMLALGVLISSIILRRADGMPRLYWPKTLGLLLFYLGYCVFSVHNSDPQVFGVLELSKIVRGIIVFLCGAFYLRTTRELMLLAVALGCVAYVETAFGLRQKVLMGMERVDGTVTHSNSLSMYMVLIGPMLVAAAVVTKSTLLRLFFATAAVCATFSTFLTLSRTGLAVSGLVMAAAVAFCCDWSFSWKKLGLVVVAMMVGCVMLGVMWPKIQARFAYSSFADEYIETEGENRGIYIRWALMMGEDHKYGVGLNNWSYWVSKDYGYRVGSFKYNEYMLGQTEDDERSDRGTYAPPAHNLLALTLGELGYPGLAIFSLIWLRWLVMGARYVFRRADRMRNWGLGLGLGVGGLFLHSVTEWNYRQTTLMFTTHLFVGALVSLCWLRTYRPPVVVEEEDLSTPEAQPMQVREALPARV